MYMRGLREVKALLDEGVLSAEEFTAEKEELLLQCNVRTVLAARGGEGVEDAPAVHITNGAAAIHTPEKGGDDDNDDEVESIVSSSSPCEAACLPPPSHVSRVSSLASTLEVRDDFTHKDRHTYANRAANTMSMLQIIREKHAKLVIQRENSSHFIHTQCFAGSICPPKPVLHDKHSGVDTVLLSNMALLLDVIYAELSLKNTKLQKTSRNEIINSLESCGSAYENPIFSALCEELNSMRDLPCPRP